MKKIYPCFLLLFTIALCSCHKNNPVLPAPGDNAAKHKIGFTITGATQTNNQTNSAGLTVNTTRTPPPPLTVLYQLIYNSADSLIKSSRQLNTDTGFGTFTDSLANGNYKVVFLEMTNVVGNIIPQLQDSTSLANVQISRAPDMSGLLFEKKLSLTVNHKDADNTVTLDRAVGQLLIVLTDAIPQNAAAITIDIDYIPTAFSINNQAAVGPGLAATGIDLHYTITPDQVGKVNAMFGPYYFLQVAPIPVTITATDASFKTLATAKAEVSFTNNRVTLLKGNLFGGSGNTGTAPGITIDPSWNQTPLNVSF